jgi:hypothetical protein
MCWFNLGRCVAAWDIGLFGCSTCCIHVNFVDLLNWYMNHPHWHVLLYFVQITCFTSLEKFFTYRLILVIFGGLVSL